MKTLIESFTRKIVSEHPQTAPWLEGYSTDLETQINVDPRGLEEAVPSGWTFYHEGFGYQTSHVRIPRNANSLAASWRPREPLGPIHHTWGLFGTSGWNWADKQSNWVGFDFDSVANHAEGLSPDQLAEVRCRASSLDYVTTRTSKSGEGIHLIVYFGKEVRPTTRTHNEHAALAKDVLHRMSRDSGFDFSGPADCLGRILWHWTKGMTDDGCCELTND